jgi:hypothetical protein
VRLASRHSQRRAKAGAGARVSSLLILQAVAAQFVADRRRRGHAAAAPPNNAMNCRRRI